MKTAEVKLSNEGFMAKAPANVSLKLKNVWLQHRQILSASPHNSQR
jgi:hypothetical protein